MRSKSGRMSRQPQVKAGAAAGEEREQDRRAAAVADGGAERDAGPAELGKRADAGGQRVAERPC